MVSTIDSVGKSHHKWSLTQSLYRKASAIKSNMKECKTLQVTLEIVQSMSITNYNLPFDFVFHTVNSIVKKSIPLIRIECKLHKALE